MSVGRIITISFSIIAIVIMFFNTTRVALADQTENLSCKIVIPVYTKPMQTIDPYEWKFTMHAADGLNKTQRFGRCHSEMKERLEGMKSFFDDGVCGCYLNDEKIGYVYRYAQTSCLNTCRVRSITGPAEYIEQ